LFEPSFLWPDSTNISIFIEAQGDIDKSAAASCIYRNKFDARVFWVEVERVVQAQRPIIATIEEERS